jgi:glyoxylase-like metal-dependent hydrolase (beta-lactamase superfamily II)
VAVRVIPVELSTFVWPYGPLKGQTGVVLIFAVEADGRWIVFDTGIGRPVPDLAEYAITTRPITEALAEAEVPVERIAAIVNCHLHFDHCGQNASFPGVPIFTQSAEWAAAHQPDYTILDAVDFEGSDYRFVDGPAHLLPTVSIVPTPGHTPGHQALVIDSPEERIVLAGQACYSPAEWVDENDVAEGRTSSWNSELYAASLARLRALQPDVVWFSHDRQPWRRGATVA